MTPPADQRWNQSWTVLLGPNLLGSWSHWQPLRIRKMMPLSTFRQLATLRPVGFLGQNSRRMGSICSQSASGTSQMVGSGLVFGFRLAFGFRLVVVVAIAGTLQSMYTFHCNSRRAKAKSAFSDSF
jgi:hypothetical protein